MGMSGSYEMAKTRTCYSSVGLVQLWSEWDLEGSANRNGGAGAASGAFCQSFPAQCKVSLSLVPLLRRDSKDAHSGSPAFEITRYCWLESHSANLFYVILPLKLLLQLSPITGKTNRHDGVERWRQPTTVRRTSRP